MSIILSLFMVSVLVTAATSQSPKPNVLVLLIDDMGYGDLEFTGAPWTTPNVNALKDEGLWFREYYVEPECTPTRSSLLSGRYPHEIGTQRAFSAGSNATLPHNLTLVTNVMKMGGYSTYLFGKWHLGYLNWDDTPHRRGFDEFIGIYQGEGEQYAHNVTLNNPCGAGQVTGYDYWNQTSLFDTRGWTNDTARYSGYIYREEGKRILRKHAASSTPFFLEMSFQTSHTPYSYPPNYSSTYASECNFSAVLTSIQDGSNAVGQFCGTVKYMDDTVGEIVSLLKSSGLWNNTLVILTTDNGGIPYNYSLPAFAGPGEASNGPYRGAKGCVFEGGIRGVGVVSGGLLPASKRNTTTHALSHVADWFPTVVDYAGLSSALSGVKMNGVSQRCVINGTCAQSSYPRTEAYIGMDVGPSGAAFGTVNGSRWKYIVLPANKGNQFTTYFDFSWTRSIAAAPANTVCGTRLSNPFANPFNTTILLFNLSADPSECTNVASMNPDVVAFLHAKLLVQPVAEAIQPPGGGTICAAAPKNNNGVWTPLYGSQFVAPTMMPTSAPTAAGSGASRVAIWGAVAVVVGVCVHGGML